MSKRRGGPAGARTRGGALSRRELLRVGGVLIPAAAFVPGIFTRPLRAATSNTFDFYISPAGNDSNPGTLASPWAITAINTRQSIYAGRRVGIIAGTYDVSGLMGAFHSPALNINGGPNAATPTYIASCNSSGVYQARGAILDAKGSSGVYGGGNTNISTIIGVAQRDAAPGGPTPANWGNWTLDGIVLEGFNIWAAQVGSYDGGGGNAPNVTIQNCVFQNSNGSNGHWNGAHTGPLELYSYSNCMVTNCLFSNNVNTNADNTHFACITVWGGNGSCSGLTIQYCTIINSGTTYGIYDFGRISGTRIQNNYFDMTGQNAAAAILGFGNSAAAGAAGSIFRNNIVRGGYLIDASAGNTGQDYWSTTAACYNNTWDLAKGAGQSGGVGIRFLEAPGHSGLFSCYNNLIYDGGATGLSGYGYNACNSDGFAVCDYNIYGMFNHFTTYGANGGSSGNAQSFAGWRSSIGGKEAHSTANSANPFTNNGALSLQYQVQAGSPAYQTGRVGGVPSGAVCNVGAWDGIVGAIGCDFAGGGSSQQGTPEAPVLTVS